MNKKIIKQISLSLMIILSILLLPTGILTSAKEEESKGGGVNSIEAKSYLLMEPISGKILYENNVDEKFAPASVTKIMTMLLTMEAVDSGKIKLSDKVTCSENAKKMGGSTMLLDTGEVRTVEELLKGVGIASGNDAAVALAEYLGGSEEAFVVMMNTRAKELGMKNTHFTNVTGLHNNNHYTTVFDLSLLLDYALEDEIFRTIFTTERYSTSFNSKRYSINVS